MARSDEAVSCFSVLLQQAQAASENLRFDELPEALGVERLRTLLWLRLRWSGVAAPARLAGEYRSELAEIIRA